MNKKNLREVLGKCSKAELIQIIMKASGMTFTTFPWMKMIAEIRLNEIESKINANLVEGKGLTYKFGEMAENQHNYTNDEVLKIRIALAKNRKEWKQLNSKYDKIFKELYG